jgi:probable F420-dependent oxidoreductase
MGDVLFGTGLRNPEGVVEFAQRAEALGFDVLGCGEHVSFYVPTANTYISLAVAAGATTRIKLMSTIVLLPLYPAALAAKLGAALDVASNGRYMFGVGIGGEIPREFEACGVPIKERGPRTDEALQIIRKLWTEETVTFEGRFNTLNEVSISPAPMQKPNPPIWVAGRRDAAMRRAAKYADGWLPYMYTPEMLANSIEKIHQFGVEHERDLSSFTPGRFIFTSVHKDRQTAIDMAGARLGRQYSQDFSTLTGKYVLAGTPQDCRDRLEQYIDAGAKLVMLSSACPDEYINENIELIANEVIPPFR